jgi:hypothetical protein
MTISRRAALNYKFIILHTQLASTHLIFNIQECYNE